MNKLYLSLLLFLFACETPLDIEIPNSNSRLMIYSVFSSDEFWRVFVGKSLPLDKPTTPIPYIENATVLIFENNVLMEQLSYEKDGIYTSQTHKPKKGYSYKIIVEAPNFNRVEATGQIPETGFISKLTESTQNITTSLNLDITDAPFSAYYKVEILQDVGDTKPYRVYFESSSPLFEELSLYDAFLNNNYNRQHTDIFSDASFNGQRVSLVLETNAKEFNRLWVRLFTLSEDLYKYNTTLNKASRQSDNPFQEPIQLYTNVTGGWGIFAGINYVDSVHLIHNDITLENLSGIYSLVDMQYGYQRPNLNEAQIELRLNPNNQYLCKVFLAPRFNPMNTGLAIDTTLTGNFTLTGNRFSFDEAIVALFGSMEWTYFNGVITYNQGDFAIQLRRE